MTRSFTSTRLLPISPPFDFTDACFVGTAFRIVSACVAFRAAVRGRDGRADFGTYQCFVQRPLLFAAVKLFVQPWTLHVRRVGVRFDMVLSFSGFSLTTELGVERPAAVVGVCGTGRSALR